MKALKVFAVIFVLGIIFSFSGCKKSLPGETPYTSDYLDELDYLLYENEDYQYQIRYPDIFNDSDEYENGIVFTSDDTKLSVWATRNTDGITLEESYNAALATFENPSADGGISKNIYCFYYTDDDDTMGYYYVMYYNETFYGFKMTFPTDKEEDFKEQIKNIEKNFLILDSSGAE